MLEHDHATERETINFIFAVFQHIPGGHLAMWKRINKPKWAPTHYTKQINPWETEGEKESFKYCWAYIDEYGLTIVYQKESTVWKNHRYFSTSVYLYANEIRQGLRLSNILRTELENGYTKNAEALLWRNPDIKNIADLLEAIEKDEEETLKKGK